MSDHGFGQLLLQSRKALGLSQAETADMAGLSIPSVRSAERSGGTIRTYLRLAACIGHSLRIAEARSSDQCYSALVAARRRKGLTQREAAEASGLSLPTIVNLEKRFAGRLVNLQCYVDLLDLQPRLVVQRKSRTQRATTRRRLTPKTNTPQMDIVQTPRPLARAIVEHFSFEGPYLDPCRGQGSFYDAFPANAERHWCEILEGKNFLEWTTPVSVCMSNPPWSKFRLFLVQAMSIADDIVFVCNWNHLSTKARHTDIRTSGFGLRAFVMIPEPRGDWPRAGFQPGVVHIQRAWTGPMEFIDRTETWQHTVSEDET